MKTLVVYLAGITYFATTYAVSLVDFQPNFLAMNGSKKNHHAKNHSLLTSNVNINSGAGGSKGSSWSANSSEKCLSESSDMRNSVFCKSVTSNKDNQQKVPAGLQANTNTDGISSKTLTTEPKQNALQSNAMRAAMGRYDNNYILSIKPGEDTDLGISAGQNGFNGLKFDMKY
jgi:hypothetical protein